MIYLCTQHVLCEPLMPLMLSLPISSTVRAIVLALPLTQVRGGVVVQPSIVRDARRADVLGR